MSFPLSSSAEVPMDRWKLVAACTFALVTFAQVALAQSLQDRMNQACASSRSFTLGAGILQTTNMTIPAGCTIIGQGENSTTLQQAAGSATAAKPFITMTSGELRNLTVDGNEANQSVARPDPMVSCVRISNTTRARLTNV